MKNKFIAISAIFLGINLSASAQVVVKDAWARATVAQQKSTGIFLQIESKKDAKLINVKTDIAEISEIHEMSMDNNVMKMREVESVILPAGKLVELKPGGFHIMLMQLKNQVKVGDEIALTLTIETADKKQETIEVKAKARALTMKSH
jgi:copper(I)-binding protein